MSGSWENVTGSATEEVYSETEVIEPTTTDEPATEEGPVVEVDEEAATLSEDLASESEEVSTPTSFVAEHIVDYPFEQDVYKWLTEKRRGGIRAKYYIDMGRAHFIADRLGRRLKDEEVIGVFIDLDGEPIPSALNSDGNIIFQPIWALQIRDPRDAEMAHWEPKNGSTLTTEDLPNICVSWGDRHPLAGELKEVGNFVPLRAGKGGLWVPKGFHGTPFYFSPNGIVYPNKEGSLGKIRIKVGFRVLATRRTPPGEKKPRSYLVPSMSYDQAEGFCKFRNDKVQARQDRNAAMDQEAEEMASSSYKRREQYDRKGQGKPKKLYRFEGNTAYDTSDKEEAGEE